MNDINHYIKALFIWLCVKLPQYLRGAGWVGFNTTLNELRLIETLTDDVTTITIAFTYRDAMREKVKVLMALQAAKCQGMNITMLYDWIMTNFPYNKSNQRIELDVIGEAIKTHSEWVKYPSLCEFDSPMTFIDNAVLLTLFDKIFEIGLERLISQTTTLLKDVEQECETYKAR